MNKLLSVLIILIVIFVTGLACVTKPVMHKQMMIVGSEYVFVEESKKEEPKTEKTKTLPKKLQQEEAKKVQVVQSKVKQNKGNKVEIKTEKEIQLKPKNEQNKIKEVVTQEPEKNEKPQVIESNSHEKVEPPVFEQKELSEEEEIIAWNKWRSDLQNQIMRDTKISAPIGVTFKFSFTVDKFGNMSNIKVWSETAGYSDMAINAIKPVLVSYQRQPILNFPQGTKRVITNVAGGFVMSATTGYSSPSDYSDYERIKR